MSGLSPSDAAVAVRSFPRRFRALLARPEDDRSGEEAPDPDELARRPGPDGTSAAGHLVAADGVLTLVDRALEQAVGRPDPTLDAAVAGLTDVTSTVPRRSLGDLLEQFEDTASDCARRIDAVTTDTWTLQVRVADREGTTGVIDLVREGVDVVAGHLRAAERTIEAVR